jgi:hypothetical protein
MMGLEEYFSEEPKVYHIEGNTVGMGAVSASSGLWP